MTAASRSEPLFGPGVRHILWPVHRRGRIWSFAMVGVPEGAAFIPLEVGLARVAAGVGGFVGGVAAVWALTGLGVLPEDLAEGAASLIVAGAIAFLSERLARREALRRMRRILADPRKHAARRRSFVVPPHARLSVQGKRRGLVATFEWADAGRPRRVSVALPADGEHEFREIWHAVRL